MPANTNASQARSDPNRFADHFQDLLGPDIAETLKVTTFLSDTNPIGLVKEFPTFSKLGELVATHRQGQKAGRMWSPATFTNDHRSNANVIEVSLAVFDVDHGPSIPDSLNALQSAGVKALVVSTFQHTVAAPRFRVIVPVENPWCAAAYTTRHAANLAWREGRKRLADVLGLTEDPNAAEPARAFYLPRHPEGAVPESHFVEGDAFDVWPVPLPSDDIVDALADEEGFPDWLDEVSEEDAEILRSAISALPNDARFADRADWLKVIAALRHSLGEAGRADAEAWSRRWTDGAHDQKAFDRAWRSIKPQYQGRKAGIGTILALAKEAGWNDPREVSPLSATSVGLLSAERRAADKRAVFGDVWAGARHADRFRGERVFDSLSQKWLAWTGQRWIAQTDEDVAADTKATSATLLTEMAKRVTQDSSDRNQSLLAKASRLHGSLAAIARMEQSSRSEPEMSVLGALEFDRDPLSLTVTNGIVDLRTGRLRPARPVDRVSKLANVAFDPGATAPKWRAFLNRIQPDPEIQSLLQQVAGMALTGDVSEEKFLLFFGSGANGKSVFCEVLETLLGEFAASLGSALVTKGKHENEAQRLVARLPGVRLALVNETGAGDVFDSQRVKELSSRDKLSARHLYKASFDFAPTHTLIIRTNHLPGSQDSGDGFWRRCIPIPFAVQIPAAERVLNLSQQIIRQELPGVFNWALAGVRQWQASGRLTIPAAIEAIRSEYRESTDLIGQWMRENTIRDPAARTETKDAFRDYVRFCQGENVSPGSGNQFGRMMTQRGIMRDNHKGSGTRYIGFRLAEADLGDDDFAG